MNKAQFYLKYKESLDLDNKSWDFIEKGNRKDNNISVSQYREVDKDYLYYNYSGIIYELCLLDVDFITDKSLRQRIKQVLLTKTTETEDINPIKFVLRPGKATHMVELSLNYATKVAEKVTTKQILTKAEYEDIAQKPEPVSTLIETGPELDNMAIIQELMNPNWLSLAFQGILEIKKSNYSRAEIEKTITYLQNLLK